MSNIVTGTVTGEVDQGGIYKDLGTIRREAAINEGTTISTVKDATESLSNQASQFYIAAQNAAAQAATALAALTASTNAQFTATQTAVELSQDKNAAAVALTQAQLSLQVAAEGERTRALIQASKIEDLRFENLYLKGRDDRGHRGREGMFTYGAPTAATYPTAA